MATLLYRLGKFCFRRRGFILGAWLLIMTAALLCAGLFMGKLSTSFTIPGTEAQSTLERLEKELPEFSASSGLIVFKTDDDKPFTDEEKKNISEALSSLHSQESSNGSPIDDVKGVVDPFKQEESREKTAGQLEAGKIELGQKKPLLEQNKARLEKARAQLEDAKRKAESVGMPLPPEVQAQATQLEAGEKELKSGETKLKASERLLQLSERGAKAVENFSSVSPDGAVAIAQVQLAKPLPEISDDTRSEIRNRINEAKDDGKLGPVAVEFSQDLAFEVPQLIGPGEITGLVFAGIVLLITLGTLIAAGLPLLQALIGVAIGVGATFALSSAIEMSSITTTLAVMLGLAVGIDYALFIVTRYRRELLNGIAPLEAAGRSIGTAGSAVVVAGLTVVIALTALSVPGFEALTIMGVAAAFTVSIAVLIAITLTPALFGFVGTKLLSKKARAAIGKNSGVKEQGHYIGAYGKFLGKNSVPLLIVATILLGLIALPGLHLRLGLPDGSGESTDSSAYKAYKMVEDNFGGGRNAAILVVATLPKDDNRTNAEVATKALDVADNLSDLDNVNAIVPLSMATPDNADKPSNTNLALLQIIPREGPSAEGTVQLVKDLRNGKDEIREKTDADIAVTGRSALDIDVSQKLADAMPIYVLIVVGLSLVLLLMLFRSVLLPILATLGFLLSLAASFGASVAVYQWGWLSSVFDVHDPRTIFSFMPIVLVGVLFGLAMDYQVFLGSSIRESYVHGKKDPHSVRQAVLEGLSHSKRVISAAALIMISVFAGFIFNDSPLIRPIGFALAFGIAFDAFLVRLIIIPAAMHLMGKTVWWIPRWLDRILPNVDVEGENLRTNPNAEAPAKPAVTRNK